MPKRAFRVSPSLRKKDRARFSCSLNISPYPSQLSPPLIHYLTSESCPLLKPSFSLNATLILTFALKERYPIVNLSRCCQQTLLAPDRPPWPRRLRLTKIPSSIICPTCMRHGRPISVPAMPCSEGQAPSLSSWAKPEPTRAPFRRIMPCT